MRLALICLIVSDLLASSLLAAAQQRDQRTPETLIEKSVKDLTQGSVGAAVKDDIKALRRGPLLMHGNYCGIGNRPGKPPIDALDAACMRHDACTRTGKLPSCACDDRLRIEASAVAGAPGTPPDVQAAATATAGAMALLICKVEPRAAQSAPAAQPVQEAPAQEVPPREAPAAAPAGEERATRTAEPTR